MKKLALTIAIVLGLSMASFAQGGLFQRGASDENTGNREDGIAMPGIPDHNLSGNQDGNDTTPLGSGIVVLMGLGAAYLVGKKRKED